MDELVVLVDVDHTLLDGALVRERISERVVDVAGTAALGPFWDLYEGVRAALGRVDVPETTLRLEARLSLPAGSVLAAVQEADYAACVYAGALEALRHLGGLGRTVLLSDGDGQYQRIKLERAGLVEAVEGRVLITTHKERELDEVLRRYPARHYALLDDRRPILAVVKTALGERVTTVLVRQGRYADESSPDGAAPDIEVRSIAEVARFDLATLRGART